MMAQNRLALLKTPLAATTLLLGVAYVAITLVFLRAYLLWDAQWLLSLALLPLVTLPGHQRKASLPLLFTACFFIAAGGYLQVNTLFFLALLLAVWYGMQSLWGRTGLYPLLLLLIGSPIFFYFSNIWSFPLRLQLTQWAVYLLAFAYPSAEVAGNLILINGSEFSVDPACAGLNMLSFSLLLAVFLLAMLHKSIRKPWPLWAVGAGLAGMVALNVAANLLRILLLVIFRIGPEQAMHDVVGMVCLVLYALLPFFFIARLALRRLPAAPAPTFNPPPLKDKIRTKVVLLNVLLVVALGVAGNRLGDKKNSFPTVAPLVQGFKAESLPDGIQKLTNEHALIYLKPIRAFYSAEHHPFICWQGSGFVFKEVQQQDVAGHQLYRGKLKNGQDLLYTAWWMDNGQHKTITQTDWRWRMLKGEPPFYLVNVTAASQAELEKQIRLFLLQRENTFAFSGQ